MAEFCMPSLGSDMEDGTLIEWEKQVGEEVRRGDIIAVVETQKGAIEVEVYEDGVIEKTLVSIGDKVPVGTPMAFIGDRSNTDKEETKQTSHAKSVNTINQRGSFTAKPEKKFGKDVKKESDALITTTTLPTDENQRVRVTPAAKQLADKAHVDLQALVGTGVNSAIVLDDVKAAIKENKTLENGDNKPETTAHKSKKQMGGMRDAIAAAMSRSKRDIPHYYLSHTIDIDRAVAYLSLTNAERSPDNRLLLGALFIKAVALAAKQFPEFNGYFENEFFTPSDAIHIGMAINLRGGGLVAPAIHDADTLTLDETMVALKDLVARVRKGRYKASELSDPTLTVSSLGERGVDSLYGVIYPPQVAIVGFGTPKDALLIRDGDIESTKTVSITLAADHRVSDGHRGSLFLRAIDQQLQKPEELK